MTFKYLFALILLQNMFFGQMFIGGGFTDQKTCPTNNCNASPFDYLQVVQSSAKLFQCTPKEDNIYLIKYETQVVAGVNYNALFEVHCFENCVAYIGISVFKPLNGPAEIRKFFYSRSKSDVLSGISFQTSADCGIKCSAPKKNNIRRRYEHKNMNDMPFPNFGVNPIVIDKRPIYGNPAPIRNQNNQNDSNQMNSAINLGGFPIPQSISQLNSNGKKQVNSVLNAFGNNRVSPQAIEQFNIDGQNQSNFVSNMNEEDNFGQLIGQFNANGQDQTNSVFNWNRNGNNEQQAINQSNLNGKNQLNFVGNYPQNQVNNQQANQSNNLSPLSWKMNYGQNTALAPIQVEASNLQFNPAVFGQVGTVPQNPMRIQIRNEEDENNNSQENNFGGNFNRHRHNNSPGNNPQVSILPVLQTHATPVTSGPASFSFGDNQTMQDLFENQDQSNGFASRPNNNQFSNAILPTALIHNTNIVTNNDGSENQEIDQTINNYFIGKKNDNDEEN